MIRAKSLILIGSGGRNSGKTTLAEALIRLCSPGFPVAALKVTTVAEEGHCHRGEEGCGACAGFSGYALMEETDRAAPRDSSRLLAAGAEPVFWLRSLRSRMEEAYAAFLEGINPGSLIIAESNTLRTLVEPGCFIMVRPPRGEEGTEAPVMLKPSAARVAALADCVLDSPLPPGAAADIYSRLIIAEDAGRLQVSLRRAVYGT